MFSSKLLVLKTDDDSQITTESMMEDCRAMKSEQQHSIDARLTKSMAALSVVGVIFMPGQFLAGVFGMNFHFMPLIESQYGWVTFWGAVIISQFTMWFVFRWYRVL